MQAYVSSMILQLFGTSSNLLCVFITCSYILSLYSIPAKIRALPRDNSVHIKYRLAAVSASTFTSGILCFILFRDWGFPLDVSFFEAIGLRLDTAIRSLVVSALLMTIFYIGPIVAWTWHTVTLSSYVVSWNGSLSERQERLTGLGCIQFQIEKMQAGINGIMVLRNLIVAPITEELVFRAFMVPAMFFLDRSSSNNNLSSNTPNTSGHSGSSNSSRILSVALIVPCYFALAHLHHCWERIRTGTPVVKALSGTMLQAAYTSIFGAIAALLFMRTGNIIAPVVSHIYCNFMGLPDVGFLAQSRDQSSSMRSELSFLYTYRHFLLVLYALGLVLFTCVLYPFTEGFVSYSPYR